jgi:hypothetical protein
MPTLNWQAVVIQLAGCYHSTGRLLSYKNIPRCLNFNYIEAVKALLWNQ